MARAALAITDVSTDADTCCADPGRLAPLDRADAAVAAVRLKAVADPVRLQLISLIRASDNGEACVCDLIEPVGLTQPTISYHLKILVQAGILEREQRGTWAWFRLVPERLEEIAASLR